MKSLNTTGKFELYTNGELAEFVEQEMDLDHEDYEECLAEVELRIEISEGLGTDLEGLEYSWIANQA